MYTDLLSRILKKINDIGMFQHNFNPLNKLTGALNTYRHRIHTDKLKTFRLHVLRYCPK